MKKNVALEKLKNDLKKRVRLYQSVFGTIDGAKVLSQMHEEFNGEDVFSRDPQQTAYNLGKRDVVLYIQGMMNADIGESNHE
jgi:GTP cyclohydrolase II